MATPSKINTLQNTLGCISEVYDLINEDGIKSTRYINRPKGYAKVTKTRLADVIDRCQRAGLSMIGTQLKRKILDPFVFSEQVAIEKPLLVIIITDGEVRS